jgi:hypothetical protein
MFTREQMLDKAGKPITQSLFLEVGYTEEAIYTLKEVDYTYNGKVYKSMKLLYMEMADPTEYEFATTHLLGWKHWMRICENKILRKHIDEWREELEVKLRCAAARQVLEQARGGSFQASKWVADRGWGARGAGRPTKLEQEKHKRITERVEDEYQNDVVRMFKQS